MAPWAFVRRAGSSGGGGGGGRSGGSTSSSSSSSKSGSSSGSSGSAGKSPSAGTGSGSSSTKAGGSGSSSGGSGKAPGGGTFSGVKSGANTSPASKSNVGYGGSRPQIVSSTPRGSFPYGYNRPYPGAPVPIFGYWPLSWQRDSTNDTENDQGDSRPGGPLTAMALTLPGDAASTYALYGDLESVQAVSPDVMACGLVNASSTPDLATNQTLALYRSDSFALIYFGSSANATTVGCVNDTLINELPILGDSSAATSLSVSLLLASLVALNLVRAFRF